MQEERPLSVTEAMTAAKRALEGVQLRVIGEVSEFNDKAGYKAAYFSICDGGATMPCMMWRDDYRAAGVSLSCGMLLELSGYFSAYVPKGRMQFMVRRLTPAGEGQLRLQVAALARKLELEGLMRPERKRALPLFPERIAVVTSPRGKAVHDVLRTLKRRFPLAEVLLAGVQVEGADAAAEIVRGLGIAAQSAPDVVLLVRGGGSYEDLMPFNHEDVARAVVSMPVPVVTGIGHEPDTCIADMVADLRASTPTGAAEAVVPATAEVGRRLARDSRSLAQALAHQLQDAFHRVSRCVERPVFCQPYVLLGPALQTLDALEMALQRALPAQLERRARSLEAHAQRLLTSGTRLLERPGAALALAAARLDDLSPLAILGRGYAVCFAEDGRTVVSSVNDVEPAQRVQVRVRDGSIACRVEAARVADSTVGTTETEE